MTSPLPTTGDPIGDALAFAAVASVTLGATLASFGMTEEVKRRDTDDQPEPGRW